MIEPDSNPYPGRVQEQIGAKTQCARILRLLIEARGAWVPLPQVMACAAQYNARVLDLRRLGYAIENRIEKINRKRHSWFRLVNSPANTTVEKTESDYMERVRKEEAAAMPLFAEVREL